MATAQTINKTTNKQIIMVLLRLLAFLYSNISLLTFFSSLFSSNFITFNYIIKQKKVNM